MDQKIIRVLSFGAGVQSSALLLMAENGDIPPVDFAVFADPKSESEDVYIWLDKIKKHIKKTKLIIATAGNIEKDIVDYWSGIKKRVAQPPFHALASNPNNGEETRGMIRRHCTVEYKIDVVDKVVRRELGYKKNERIKEHVEMVIGISYDEMQRMRISQQKWKSLHYPLVDMKLRRNDCIQYVEKFGLGKPPRSACFFCPYKSNKEWSKLKNESPNDWKKAVEFDHKIRKSVTAGLTSDFFVHRDCVPLDKADLTTGDENQMSFLDECEGMCGN